MDITVPQIIGALSAGSAISVAIFQGAYYIGKSINRLENIEARVHDHDERLEQAGI